MFPEIENSIVLGTERSLDASLLPRRLAVIRSLVIAWVKWMSSRVPAQFEKCINRRPFLAADMIRFPVSSDCLSMGESSAAMPS
jgi:hypothetical protein